MSAILSENQARIAIVLAEIEVLIIAKRDIQCENIDSGFVLWDNLAKLEILREQIGKLQLELAALEGLVGEFE